MSDLARRVLVGVPSAALFLYLTWLGGDVLLIAALIATVIVMMEMFNLFSQMKLPAWPTVSVAIGALIWLVPLLPVRAVISFSILLLLVTVVLTLRKKQTFSGRWMATLYCGLFAPLGWFLFWQIRELEPDVAAIWLTFAVIASIWCNDIFAYFGGRAFGRHPLAPSISPKKTWEGFFFGFAGSLAGLFLITAAAPDFPLSIATSVPLAIIISLFGPAGDLIASKLKRLAGVKDSSGLLPGHGGFLDRFDSFLFCMPFVFLYLTLII